MLSVYDPRILKPTANGITTSSQTCTTCTHQDALLFTLQKICSQMCPRASAEWFKSGSFKQHHSPVVQSTKCDLSCQQNAPWVFPRNTHSVSLRYWTFLLLLLFISAARLYYQPKTPETQKTGTLWHFVISIPVNVSIIDSKYSGRQQWKSKVSLHFFLCE